MSQRKDEEIKENSINMPRIPFQPQLSSIGNPARYLPRIPLMNTPANFARPFIPNVNYSFPYMHPRQVFQMNRGNLPNGRYSNMVPSTPYLGSLPYIPNPSLQHPNPNNLFFSGGSVYVPQSNMDFNHTPPVPSVIQRPNNSYAAQPGSDPNKDESKKLQEESLEKIPEIKMCKLLFKGNSYQCRNVYKSIMVNMLSYLKLNRDDIFLILTSQKYTRSDIEHAILKITYYNDNDRKKGSSKISQSIINKMLSKKTIYTFILRETLKAMMQNSEGIEKKVSGKNIGTYKEVCSKIYEETVKLIG